MRVACLFAVVFCCQLGTAQKALITAGRPVSPMGFRLFSAVGLDSHVGVGGIGFDVATPVGRRFNIRAGSDFFGYSTTFEEQGAHIAAQIRMQSAHASLDWFPFGGGFRLSPLLVFADENRARATAVIPPGETLTLDSQNFVSSANDPLHGAGSVDFRKVGPGFSFGFGNIVPRRGSHFSFPVEAGFYYIGQPGLRVAFTGSACDPDVPADISCEPINQDPSFQRSLAAFIARNQHNLSYASYFPIFSFGFGYSIRAQR